MSDDIILGGRKCNILRPDNGRLKTKVIFKNIYTYNNAILFWAKK